MAAITKADLRNRVLQHIGILAAGETASSADATLVDGYIETVFEELDKIGTVEAGFTSNNIPDWAQNAFRDRVAYLVAPAFSLPIERVRELAQLAVPAYLSLIRHQQAYAAHTTDTDLVHKALQKLGVIQQGEDAPAAHTQTMTEVAASVIDWLTEDGTLQGTWTTLAQTPVWAEQYMRDIIAYRAAGTFGITDNAFIQVLRAEHDEGVAEILKRVQALAEADGSNDLRNKVATHLGLVGPGQTPTAAQAEIIDDVAASVLDWLQEYGTLSDSWTTLDTIPVWGETLMRDIVASRAAELLGVRDTASLQILKAKEDSAVSEIFKRLAAPTGGTDVLLRNAIADKLGLTLPGELPSAAQAAVIDAGIAWWFDLADEKGTVGFASDAIPNWAETYIRDIVSERVAAPLGVRDPRLLADLKGDAAIGIMEVEKRFTALGESATKTILRNQILRKLGVIGMAEDPTAAQIEVAEEMLDKIFSQLRSERTVNFTTAAIPDWAMIPLRDYMAYHMAETFQAAPTQTLYLQHRQGLKELRSQVTLRKPLTTDSITARYY